MSGWFEVDRQGLKKLFAGEDKNFILRELIQNSWDEPGVKNVSITVEKESHGKYALLIKDDDPEGFYDLSHAYKLFGNTRKRKDPTKRGRFNMGEKQILSLCERAEIKSTKGTICFNSDETRTKKRASTDLGSEVFLVFRANAKEIEDMVQFASQFIPPQGITTSVNGKVIAPRKAVNIFPRIF